MANFTQQPILVNNTAIIGESKTNMASNTSNYTNGMTAIITPRSGQTNISNVRFYNYPVGSLALKVCDQCDNPKIFTNVGT